PPTVSHLVLDHTIINENDVITLTGDVDDLGVQDTHSLEIDWGDGTAHSFTGSADPNTTVIFTEANGHGTFIATHRYLDDYPVGTPRDTFTIKVTATDDDTGQGSATIKETVKNVDPTVTIKATGTGSTGVILIGSVDDIGSLDTH